MPLSRSRPESPLIILQLMLLVVAFVACAQKITPRKQNKRTVPVPDSLNHNEEMFFSGYAVENSNDRFGSPFVMDLSWALQQSPETGLKAELTLLETDCGDEAEVSFALSGSDHFLIAERSESTWVFDEVPDSSQLHLVVMTEASCSASGSFVLSDYVPDSVDPAEDLKKKCEKESDRVWQDGKCVPTTNPEKEKCEQNPTRIWLENQCEMREFAYPETPIDDELKNYVWAEQSEDVATVIEFDDSGTGIFGVRENELTRILFRFESRSIESLPFGNFVIKVLDHEEREQEYNVNDLLYCRYEIVEDEKSFMADCSKTNVKYFPESALERVFRRFDRDVGSIEN